MTVKNKYVIVPFTIAKPGERPKGMSFENTDEVIGVNTIVQQDGTVTAIFVVKTKSEEDSF